MPNALLLLDRTPDTPYDNLPRAGTALDVHNDASGLTNGTTVTTANSGGASGNAFSTVTGAITASNAVAMGGNPINYLFPATTGTATSVILPIETATGGRWYRAHYWAQMPSAGPTAAMQWLQFVNQNGSSLSRFILTIAPAGTMALQDGAGAQQPGFTPNVCDGVIRRWEVIGDTGGGGRGSVILRIYNGDGSTFYNNTWNNVFPLGSTVSRIWLGKLTTTGNLGAFTIGDIRAGINSTTEFGAPVQYPVSGTVSSSTVVSGQLSTAALLASGSVSGTSLVEEHVPVVVKRPVTGTAVAAHSTVTGGIGNQYPIATGGGTQLPFTFPATMGTSGTGTVPAITAVSGVAGTAIKTVFATGAVAGTSSATGAVHSLIGITGLNFSTTTASGFAVSPIQSETGQVVSAVVITGTPTATFKINGRVNAVTTGQVVGDPQGQLVSTGQFVSLSNVLGSPVFIQVVSGPVVEALSDARGTISVRHATSVDGHVLAISSVAGNFRPPRDLKIVGTTVPTTSWGSNGIASGWIVTQPTAATVLILTGPSSPWQTTPPSN